MKTILVKIVFCFFLAFPLEFLVSKFSDKLPTFGGVMVIFISASIFIIIRNVK